MEAVAAHYANLGERRPSFKTSVPTGRPPAYIRKAWMKVPAAVTEQFQPAPVPLPSGVDGLHVLDISCGSGRDSYIAASLVGERGKVTAVDARPDLLEVAKGAVGAFTSVLGREPALHFVLGYPEFLDAAGIAAESVDICISSSAFTLSLRPDLVLASVHRVLREGGEFQFVALLCDRRLTKAQRQHETLASEGLAAAPYDQDFVRQCQVAGFADPHEIASVRVVITDSGLRTVVGDARFRVVTYRCFKLATLEPAHEDYGQTATYLGTVPGMDAAYTLDRFHTLPTQEAVAVCGNTATILAQSWLRDHFAVAGDRSEHRGPFRFDGANSEDEELDGMMLCTDGYCTIRKL